MTYIEKIIELSDQILFLCRPLRPSMNPGRISTSDLSQAMILAAMRLLTASINKNTIHLDNEASTAIGADLMNKINKIIGDHLISAGVPVSKVDLDGPVDQIRTNLSDRN